MTRQRYSVKESLNKIIRLFQGETISELPDTISGEVLSEGEALSDLTELFNNSLPNQTFSLPIAIQSAMTSAGFASGTATSLTMITGTTQVLVGATVMVFGAGLSVSVTGTSAFINTV